MGKGRFQAQQNFGNYPQVNPVEIVIKKKLINYWVDVIQYRLFIMSCRVVSTHLLIVSIFVN